MLDIMIELGEKNEKSSAQKMVSRSEKDHAFIHKRIKVCISRRKDKGRVLDRQQPRWNKRALGMGALQQCEFPILGC